jgi:hypothetical protein
LRFRAYWIKRCRLDRKYRRAVLALFRRDIVAFINMAVWQMNPDNIGHEVGPFLTWDWQALALDRTMKRLFKKGRADMLWEKSREMGATWLAMILALWLCLFHPNKRVLLLSHKEEAIHKSGDPGTLFGKIAFMLKHLPAWMSQSVKRHKRSFAFANGSSITGSATTEAAGVGDRVHLIVLDEFSKYQSKKAYQIWGATADTGPRLVIGTHYGVSGCYYDLTQRLDIDKCVMHWTLHPEKRRGLYLSDPDKPNGFKVLDTDNFDAESTFVTTGKPFDGPGRIETPWYTGSAVGIRSPWYDQQCLRRANDRDVAQHLDIAPRQSQHNYFDSVLVATLQEATVDPIWRANMRYDPETCEPMGLMPVEDGPIQMWINPADVDANGLIVEVAADLYGMGVDVSQGIGNSNSVCSIGSVTTGRKVCEMAVSDLAPHDFALVCMALGRLFKNSEGTAAMIAWETNGPGGVFGRTLKEHHYTRLYYRESMDIMHRVKVSDVAGWNASTAGAKRNLLDQYTIALRERMFVNPSFNAFEDCKAYRFSDTKDTVEHPKHMGGPDPSGARSNHGDRVIADALCLMVLKRLGLGKIRIEDPLSVVAPAAVGTLEWRMKLAVRGELGDRKSRPIRAMRHNSRRRWR